jgi:hypothetical protein
VHRLPNILGNEADGRDHDRQTLTPFLLRHLTWHNKSPILADGVGPRVKHRNSWKDASKASTANVSSSKVHNHVCRSAQTPRVAHRQSKHERGPQQMCSGTLWTRRDPSPPRFRFRCTPPVTRTASSKEHRLQLILIPHPVTARAAVAKPGWKRGADGEKRRRRKRKASLSGSTDDESLCDSQIQKSRRGLGRRRMSAPLHHGGTLDVRDVCGGLWAV